MTYIESKIRIEGFCKKVPKKDLYRYPRTPATAYRLACIDAIKWQDYPDLEQMFLDQKKANEII